LVMDQHDATLTRQPIQSVDPKPQIILTPDGDMELFQIRITIKNGDSIFW